MAGNGDVNRGVATVMGIGKAVPEYVFLQKSFPDYYFESALEEQQQQQKPANSAAAVPDLNEMFWVVHAGGREILDRVESNLGLGKEKLDASRAVMTQYGNTRSSYVVLVTEEMRRRSEERGMRTVGEGLDMGMLVGFGPGLTIEIIVLRALPIN
ncbi:hypothetical protein ABZP36_025416 [Zizania latifolia]